MIGTEIAIPEKWRQEVETYEKKQYNVLAPRELGDVPPFHTPRLSVVTVNPDPDAGDIYALPGGKKYGLSKVALDRISQAAGVSWLPELCGRVDDGRDPNICRYKAVGIVQDLSGTRRTIIGEKEVDLVAIEDELRESIPKREWIGKLPEPKRTQAIEDTVTKEMIQFRKHKLARAQSGAMNRAIRSALALRSGYSKEEISRPFVLPRVVFTPDLNDPDVKRFMMAEYTGHVSDLYMAQANASVKPSVLPPALPPAQEDDPDTTPQDVPGIPGNGNEPKCDMTSPPEPSEGNPPPDASLLFEESYRQETAAGSEEVKAAAIEGQVKALESLITTAQYDTKNLKKPLVKFSREERKGFCDMLVKRIEAQKPKEPELPWNK